MNTRVWSVTGSSTGLGYASTDAVLGDGARVVAPARAIEQVADLEQLHLDRLPADRPRRIDRYIDYFGEWGDCRGPCRVLFPPK